MAYVNGKIYDVFPNICIFPVIILVGRVQQARESVQLFKHIIFAAEKYALNFFSFVCKQAAVTAATHLHFN